jgi:hypothetical protein
MDTTSSGTDRMEGLQMEKSRCDVLREPGVVNLILSV